jgi:hypothetical protein
MMPEAWTAADAEGADQGVFRHPAQPGGGGGGGEASGEGGGVEMARVERARHREAHPAHHLHPGHQRGQHVAAARARGLARRQRGGDGHASGVNDGVLARVVEVEAVGQGGIGEHRIGRRHAGAAAQHRALGRTAQPLRHRDGRAAEVVAAGGERIAERIQREQGARLERGGRDGVRLEARHEAGQPPRRAEGGHRAPAGLRPRRRRAGWSP